MTAGNILFGRDLDMLKVAQSEELIFEAFASVIPEEVTFNKVLCLSDFRCICVLSRPVGRHSTFFFFKANIRMVNKFSEGRVFVAGGMRLRFQ